MAYLFESLSLLSLVLDPEKVELTSLFMFWAEYSGLSAILAMALMSSISIDQLNLVQGNFKSKHQNENLASYRLYSQPITQFLKYHFLGSTRQDRIYLMGADEMGHLRFFIYNLGSSIIWLSVIAAVGTGLRYFWITLFGNFGPFEVEIIAGILAVYVSGLGIMASLKFIFCTRQKDQ